MYISPFFRLSSSCLRHRIRIAARTMANSIPAREVLSKEGELNASAFASLPFEADVDGQSSAVTVISALSAYGNGQTDFLNRVFLVGLDTSSSSPSVGLGLVSPDESAALLESGRPLLVLDVEPFDAPDGNAERREKAWNYSLCISDAVVYSLRMIDLARPKASGINSLSSALGELLRLQSMDKISAPAQKRLFIIVIHDYEQQVVSREDLIKGLTNQFQVMFDNTAKPRGHSTKLLDYFDFEFITLDNTIADATDSSDEQLRALQKRLLDPASDEYMFEHEAYSKPGGVASLPKLTETVWDALDDEAELVDLPNPAELSAAFDCDGVMRRTFEEYEQSVRVWKRDTDGGSVISKFGELAYKLKKETVEIFEKDAGIHTSSKAYKRKKNELIALIDDDMYVLYARQITKLRDTIYKTFKDTLTEVADTDNTLDRKVNSALKNSQKAFKNGADNLRPKNSPWRCDGDVKELSARMKEEAAERIQLARIAEYQNEDGRGRRRRRRNAAAGGKGRHPISLGIHYLNPAPFGIKDSRFEKLNVNDKLGYAANNAQADTKEMGGVRLMPERGETWNNFG